MENKAIIKYNGGMGAVLCNSCGCIVRAGAELTEEDKSCLRGELALHEQYCGKCIQNANSFTTVKYMTEREIYERYGVLVNLNIKNMKVKVINDKPMPGNEVGPEIKYGEEHEIISKFKCNCGEEHINIGLKMDVNWVECYKCRETLPADIRWCHSSRFVESNLFHNFVKPL